MIPDEIIEQVRDSADLIDVIGESVQLKKSGADWRGPCPFHGGTHRNFAVVPKKGMYYCYVCHEAGDVFTFLMKRFGMDYPTAVREVARRAGITIPDRPGREGPDPREPLFGAAAVAGDWFSARLRDAPDAKIARDYLESREFPLPVAAELALGYAPTDRSFITAMTELGVDERVLLEAGLLVRRDDGTVSPRFRGRLLFPIHDLRGRVVAFGGRILRSGEPKYLNSPESPIFHKGTNLYNLHQAKNAIRKEGVAIVVEGYFDALRLVAAGVESVVAPLGTALTADQATLLKRFAPTVTLLYDSDQAGLRATFRAGDECLRQGLRVLVATMPPDEDPDTLVQRGGAAALEPILKDAIDVVERKIQLLERKGWFEGVARRRTALDRLLPTIRAASDPIARDLYLTRVAERVGVSRAVLEQELAAKAPSPAMTTPKPDSVGPPSVDRARPPKSQGRRPEAKIEAQLLRLVLEAPQWLARARREVPAERFQVPAYREIFQGLSALPEDATVDVAYDRLEPQTRDAWQRLVKADMLIPDLTNADALYAAAVEALEEGELLRTGPPREDVAAHQAWLARLKPETRRKYQWRKAASRDRTRYPDARSEG